MKKNPSRNVHFSKGPSNLLDEINVSIDVDERLFKEDIAGSIAHAKMLGKQKIISKKESDKLVKGLKSIHADIEKNKVKFSRSLEDIHMNIESLLSKKIGKIVKIRMVQAEIKRKVFNSFFFTTLTILSISVYVAQREL